MVYELNYNLVFHAVFLKEQIRWKNGTKTVYDIYSCYRHLGFTQMQGFWLGLSFQYL